MLRKQVTAKRAWARMSERAEFGERFGFIACLSLLYKNGFISRAQVVESLNESHITRADLAKFREKYVSTPSAAWRFAAEGCGPEKL